MLPGCTTPAPQAARHYVATIQPAAMILQELCTGRAEVSCIVPPAASPHTYEPRPSDVRDAGNALALVQISEDLDGWAARIPASRRILLFDLLPEAAKRTYPDAVLGHTHDHDHEHDHSHDHAHDHHHDHAAGDIDPHFWADPIAVRALLPGLTSALIAADPEGQAQYEANRDRFSSELEALDKEFRAAFEPHAARPVILFHASWNYFLERYGLRLAAVIEESPGKEATPRYIESVVATVRKEGVQAVFTEPQLPRRPAEVISKAAGVALRELDPNGGVDGRMRYAELLRHNAEALLASFP